MKNCGKSLTSNQVQTHKMWQIFRVIVLNEVEYDLKRKGASRQNLWGQSYYHNYYTTYFTQSFRSGQVQCCLVVDNNIPLKPKSLPLISDIPCCFVVVRIATYCY